MPPKGASTAINPKRLQSVSKLRIERPDKQQVDPCLGVMSAMLTCWASSGMGNAGCATAEQSLRDCVDGPKPPPKRKNTINYHLSRLYPNISGPKKRKGSLG